MNALISIGDYHFLVPSASIAVAIHDVLSAAGVVDPVAIQNGRTAWRTSAHAKPQISVRQVVDEIGRVGAIQIATTPLAQAVLGEPVKSRRRTHAILAEAGREAA